MTAAQATAYPSVPTHAPSSTARAVTYCATPASGTPSHSHRPSRATSATTSSAYQG